GLAVSAVDNPVCAGTATIIKVANSENGVLYRLHDDTNGAFFGAAVPGNGGTIDLPTDILGSTTTFSVIATNGTCSIALTDTETVDVGIAPDITLPVAALLDPL